MPLVCDICFSPASSLKCSHCGAVVDASVSTPSRPKCPAQLSVSERPGYLRLSWEWRKAQSGALLAFAAAWDVFLGVWYSNWIPSASSPALMGALPAIHLILGAWLTWFAASQFFNRSVLEVTQEHVSVRSGPLPARRDASVPVAMLDVVYAGNGSVVAECRDGSSVVLCEGLDGELATYLADAIRLRTATTVAAFDRMPRAAAPRAVPARA